jgi:hypothetical protein
VTRPPRGRYAAPPDDRDLVTRLREYRIDVDSPDVVAEAADEIERLRKQLAVQKFERMAEQAKARRLMAADYPDDPEILAEQDAADELSRLGQELGT